MFSSFFFYMEDAQWVCHDQIVFTTSNSVHILGCHEISISNGGVDGFSSSHWSNKDESFIFFWCLAICLLFSLEEITFWLLFQFWLSLMAINTISWLGNDKLVYTISTPYPIQDMNLKKTFPIVYFVLMFSTWGRFNLISFYCWNTNTESNFKFTAGVLNKKYYRKKKEWHISLMIKVVAIFTSQTSELIFFQNCENKNHDIMLSSWTEKPCCAGMTWQTIHNKFWNICIK